MFIKTYYFINSFPKELLFTLLFSLRFYKILSLLEDFFNKNKSSKDGKSSEIIEPFQISTYFFCDIFI